MCVNEHTYTQKHASIFNHVHTCTHAQDKLLSNTNCHQTPQLMCILHMCTRMADTINLINCQKKTYLATKKSIILIKIASDQRVTTTFLGLVTLNVIRTECKGPLALPHWHTLSTTCTHTSTHSTLSCI